MHKLESSDNRARYLELLKQSLLNELYPELEAQLLQVVLNLAYRRELAFETIWQAREDAGLLAAIGSAREGGDTVTLRGLDELGVEVDRPELRNYSEFAHTMIGRARLDHLQWCVEQVLQEGISGDLMEAGVWRGGACILMKGVLACHGDTKRKVWVADSFQGVPAPSAAQDAGYDMSATRLPVLAVSAEAVRALFARYRLLDERVRFIEGWFDQSLAQADPPALSLLRIDADLYQSTWDVLHALYARVAPGGFVIVDDYRILPPCREAVDQFRSLYRISDPIEIIDGHAIFWRKFSA